MNDIQKHILFKITTVLTVVLLMLPLVVKSTLIFEDHKHDICIDDQQASHLHAKDIHCEFYKFKIFTQYLIIENNSESITEKTSSKSNFLHYNFLHNNRPSSQFLRGPPHFA
jgi:hypothetical protein